MSLTRRLRRRAFHRATWPVSEFGGRSLTAMRSSYHRPTMILTRRKQHDKDRERLGVIGLGRNPGR